MNEAVLIMSSALDSVRTSAIEVHTDVVGLFVLSRSRCAEDG